MNPELIQNHNRTRREVRFPTSAILKTTRRSQARLPNLKVTNTNPRSMLNHKLFDVGRTNRLVLFKTAMQMGWL
jgi:hypothetical protein